MLQTGSNNDVSIDMSRRSPGIGFARIAKLVTNKNVHILKKESQNGGSDMNGTKNIEDKLPE